MKHEIKLVLITKEFRGKGKNKVMLVKVYDFDGTFIAAAEHFRVKKK